MRTGCKRMRRDVEDGGTRARELSTADQVTLRRFRYQLLLVGINVPMAMREDGRWERLLWAAYSVSRQASVSPSALRFHPESPCLELSAASLLKSRRPETYPGLRVHGATSIR